MKEPNRDWVVPLSQIRDYYIVNCNSQNKNPTLEGWINYAMQNIKGNMWDGIIHKGKDLKNL